MKPESILYVAIQKKTPAERVAYLNEACSSDHKLRQEIDALLEAHEDRGKFMDKPAVEHTAGFDPDNTTGFTQQTFDQIGPYKLREKLGEGGMGTVYVADQKEPVQRRVAIKLIKTGGDSKSLLGRFEQERQALALMDHPNIAKVFDAGVFERTPYFVMELIKGVPITTYCDEACLSPKERLELFIPVCKAVQHAHQKGIIHRDLKPSNILIGLYDGKPIPKIIDFGVAKATGSRLTDQSIYTEVGSLVGTLEYMSPEQAELNNLDIDTRSDIYALGVILYELLTGSVPFSRNEMEKVGLGEMLRVIKEVEPSKPSTKLSGSGTLPSIAANRHMEPAKLSAMVRGELDWIVMKCLEKDRGRRYETANQLGMEIQRYLADEPVLAGPPSAGYRLRKFFKRNKGPVMAAGLVASALIAGIVGTTWGMWRAEQQRALAEIKESEAQSQKKRAIEFRDKALNALRATTGEDVEKLIGAKKELSANERAYLEAIASRWQVFAAQNDDEEESRAIRSEGHERVGYLWQRLGRRDEAWVEYEKARSLMAALAGRFPLNSKYGGALTGIHYRRGVLCYNFGRHAAACSEFEQARALASDLRKRFPDQPEHEQRLAITHNALGTLFRDLGKPDEALQALEAARFLLEPLAARVPDPTICQNELASLHGALGVLYAQLGRLDDAQAEFEKGQAVAEALNVRFPDVASHKRELGNALTNLGALAYRRGQFVKAMVATTKARDVRQELADQFPLVPDYQEELASVQNNLAALHQANKDPVRALLTYEQALVVNRKLCNQHHNVALYQERLATTLGNLANTLADLSKGDEALAAYQEALTLRKKHADLEPLAPDRQYYLGYAYLNLATVLTPLGKRAEARQSLDKGHAVFEKLVEKHPERPEYLTALAGVCLETGVLDEEDGKLTESLSWLDKGIKIFTPLVAKSQGDAVDRLNLCRCHGHRALVLDRLSRHADAVADWEEAWKDGGKDMPERWRGMRQLSRCKSGLVAEAVTEVAKLTKSPNWNATQCYDFACVYAVASGKLADKKQEYADRAMELLQQAVKAGYKDAVHIANDKDLDPLRDRNDFKKLLAELIKQTPPSNSK